MKDMKKLIIALMMALCSFTAMNGEPLTNDRASIEMVTKTEKTIIEAPSPRIYFDDPRVTLILVIDNERITFDAVSKYVVNDKIYLLGRDRKNQVKTIAITDNGSQMRLLTNDYRVFKFANVKITWTLMEEINDLPDVYRI